VNCNSDCTGHCLVFEPSARRLLIDHRPLELTTTEYDLLACLLLHAGRVVSRETLMSVVFGREFTPFDRSIDVHVSHLRKKLGCCRTLIVTVRTVGYLLRLKPAGQLFESGAAGAWVYEQVQPCR
jgi:DNA-binding response OmpR family regulator